MTPLTIKSMMAGQLSPADAGSLVAFYDHGRRCGRLASIWWREGGDIELLLASGEKHIVSVSSEVDVIREETA